MVNGMAARRDVYIVGVGQVGYGVIEDKRLEQVIFEACSKALGDAKISRDEIETVVMGAQDEIDGRSISSMVAAGPAGSFLKDETRATNEGIYALIVAYLYVSSGLKDVCLVSSWSKCSEAPVDLITNLRFEPFFSRSVGLNYVTASALQACVYSNERKVSEEAVAEVVVKNRENAMNNPLAHVRRFVTVEDVLSSRVVAYPLRELHLPPKSDGACALVVVSRDVAETLTNRRVTIRGMGWSTDAYYLGNRDLTKLTSLEKAAEMAYRNAGIKNPLDEINVCEVADVTAYHELMAYESLGFSDNGSTLVEEGVTRMNGELPVNPSGGILSSNPMVASGLVRVAECYLQLTRRGGDRQVRGVENALAHGSEGSCCQENAVVILGRE